MKRLRLSRLTPIVAIFCATMLSPLTQALGPVLISGAQVKGVGANTSSIEAVEVRNYSDADIEVTNWCVAYASYTATTLPSGGSCILPASPTDKVFLKRQSAIVLATTEFTASMQAAHPGFIPDAVLSSGLSNTTGQLYLFDPVRQIMNNVKWYTSAAVIDGQINLRPLSGQPENISFARQPTANGSSTTFIVSPLPLTFNAGGLYDLTDVCKNLADFQEIVPVGYAELDGDCAPIDVCTNIDGDQFEVPSGLLQVNGECIADQCPNIENVQAVMPDGYIKTSDGLCRQDVCTNIEGLQGSVPAGYYAESSECLRYEDRALMLSELLPNVSGSDTGLEYIELYNPFSDAISLRGYSLQVGKNLEKSFALPVDQEITPRGYFVITNAQLPYSLLNTSSSVQLTTPAGTIADTTSYSEPEDDMSWSFIGGTWKYTNQKTPGQANLESIIDSPIAQDEEVLAVRTLASCGPGKYRHPLTNRCRNIETDVVTLVSCDADEYRNPDTNRCRKITSLTSSLTGCAEGQERNPDTNRCRSVLAATSALTPCQEGYERNAETNRCRKAVAAAVASPGESSQGSDQSTSIPLQSPYAIGAAVAFLAFGYGIYEWRSEVVKVLKRFIPTSK